jgi:hypothetical protein
MRIFGSGVARSLFTNMATVASRFLSSSSRDSISYAPALEPTKLIHVRIPTAIWHFVGSNLQGGTSCRVLIALLCMGFTDHMAFTLGFNLRRPCRSYATAYCDTPPRPVLEISFRTHERIPWKHPRELYAASFESDAAYCIQVPHLEDLATVSAIAATLISFEVHCPTIRTCDISDISGLTAIFTFSTAFSFAAGHRSIIAQKKPFLTKSAIIFGLLSHMWTNRAQNSRVYYK